MKKQTNPASYLFALAMGATLVAGQTQAAECKVGDRWYPYSSPMCSGQKAAPQAAPAPVTNINDYPSLWPGLKKFALERCAKLHDSLFLQEVCLENERKGYLALESNYGMPSQEAMKAKARCAKLHTSWYLRDVCMQNESKSYQKLYGR